jgi:hypothetical protein
MLFGITISSGSGIGADKKFTFGIKKGMINMKTGPIGTLTVLPGGLENTFIEGAFRR